MGGRVIGDGGVSVTQSSIGLDVDFNGFIYSIGGMTTLDGAGISGRGIYAASGGVVMCEYCLIMNWNICVDCGGGIDTTGYVSFVSNTRACSQLTTCPKGQHG